MAIYQRAPLSNELKDAALQGNVLELKEVWTRYCTLSLEAGVEIPNCFESRLYTFKEKLVPYVASFYDFIVLKNQPIGDRQTLLVPVKLSHIPLSTMMVTEDDEIFTIPPYKPHDSDFMSMLPSNFDQIYWNNLHIKD